MTIEQEVKSEETNETATDIKQPKPRKKFYTVAIVFIVIWFAWVVIRPGVFTIQPIGAIPDGVTIIYRGRNSEIPFFSSPDGMCLQMQGSVSLLCRMAALSASVELTDRIILRLPYNHWAYLKSTNGLEFEK
ncbi:MAG TPA: hypothetical protein PK299_14810 [Anaerolineales bacterium]|nr:hypothetical protein [Anaerolineales bacterium]